MSIYDIIKEPIITEKTMDLVEKGNSYTFIVAKNANKIQIKKAIEKIYKVKVLNVNTINVYPKPKRMGQYSGFKASYKKAIIKLEKGNKIEGYLP